MKPPTLASQRGARGWSRCNRDVRWGRRVWRNGNARTDAPRLIRSGQGKYWVGDWRVPNLEMSPQTTGPFASFEAAEIHWMLVQHEVIR